MSDKEQLRQAILDLGHQYEDKDFMEQHGHCSLDLAAPRCAKRVKDFEALIQAAKREELEYIRDHSSGGGSWRQVIELRLTQLGQDEAVTKVVAPGSYDPLTHCACGKPLHYNSQEVAQQTERLIAESGDPFVIVSTPRGSWRVQRHYIALHGVKGYELPTLGFEGVLEGL